MTLGWSHGNGISFSGAEQQAMCLETRISARSWELSSSGEEKLGRISRNQIRLNFHLARHLFLVVMGRKGWLPERGTARCHPWLWQQGVESASGSCCLVFVCSGKSLQESKMSSGPSSGHLSRQGYPP